MLLTAIKDLCIFKQSDLGFLNKENPLLTLGQK